MTHPQTSLESLLEQIEDMEASPEKVALLEEAVRLADWSREEPLAYSLRKELIRAANYSGQSEKSIPAFVWCRHFLDEHQAEYGPWAVSYTHLTLPTICRV